MLRLLNITSLELWFLEVRNPVTCVVFNLPVSDIVNTVNRPDVEARCNVFGGDLLRRQGDINEAFDDVRDAVNPGL